MYDWANSAFATTIMTAFFPVFFKTFWNHGVDPTISTARLGLATGLGGLTVAFLSPFIGAVADAGRARKQLLSFFMFLGIIATASFYFVPAGNWQWAFAIIIFAEVGFSCGNLLYDSLIVNVAEKHDMDEVSTRGYAFGYAGGGCLFALNVLMSWKPALFGIASQVSAVRLSFPMVSVWWLVFALPLFLFVREQGSAFEKPQRLFRDGLSRLRGTVGKIAGQKHLWIFLIAYWLYIDGIYTVIVMAADFGLSIGLSPVSLMVSILLVQFVAFPSSIVFGRLAKIIGTDKAILCGIGIYCCICTIGAFLLRTSIDFMILAAFVGVAQGGVQALSRSYFGKIVPVDDAGEYFGFLNLVGKCSAIMGPFLVGAVAYCMHRAGVESHLSSRIAMSSIIIFFISGALLLQRAERARRLVESA